MADDKKPGLIWVRSSNPDKVGVWERDTNHPDGEVFVSGKDAKQVAATPLVNLQLQNGSLVRADGPASASSSLPEETEEQAPSEDERPSGRKGRA